MITSDEVKSALATYTDPFLETDLISSNVFKCLRIEQTHITLQLEYGFALSDAHQSEICKAIVNHLSSYLSNCVINVEIFCRIKSHAVQSTLTTITNVKNIIAVASGKGGVGKSTTAVNVALALRNEGASVGLLDADIYGPNQPLLLGIEKPRPSQTQNKFQPIMAHGMQTMSIGYLVDTKTPMIWRGPMVTTALMQLLNDTAWEKLDYLIVDLPPGTGDVQLTLAQKIPVAGAIIVTTPQELALQDARKGIEMFQKVKIPILGIIENMSEFVCSHCKHAEPIFGLQGGKNLAEEYHVAFLGGVPLSKSVREYSDIGKPIVVSEPSSEISLRYSQIALRMAAKLSLHQKSYAHHFPKISIEND